MTATCRPTLAFVGRGSEFSGSRGSGGGDRRTRACRLVTVIGSPGVGKSRIGPSSPATRANRRTWWRPLRAVGEGITFLPIAEVLRGVAGSRRPTARVVRAKLSLGAGRGGPGPRPSRGGGGRSSGAAAPASAEEPSGRAGYLEVVAKPRPVVVVLDDVQWASRCFSTSPSICSMGQRRPDAARRDRAARDARAARRVHVDRPAGAIDVIELALCSHGRPGPGRPLLGVSDSPRR